MAGVVGAGGEALEGGVVSAARAGRSGADFELLVFVVDGAVGDKPDKGLKGRPNAEAVR